MHVQMLVKETSSSQRRVDFKCLWSICGTGLKWCKSHRRSHARSSKHDFSLTVPATWIWATRSWPCISLRQMNLKYNSFTMSVIFRQVHEGQELAVVEAMKMQNSLHAGLSGTVSKWWKDNGDIISNLSSIFYFKLWSRASGWSPST